MIAPIPLDPLSATAFFMEISTVLQYKMEFQQMETANVCVIQVTYFLISSENVSAHHTATL